MNEELLQFIWQAGLFDAHQLLSTQGQEIEIIKRGNLNVDSGPDFSEASIRIDGALWFGQVEIHIHSDEWYKHRHHKDPAYNNTILHVVYINNEKCFRSDGTEIPCLELQYRITDNLQKTYEHLKFNRNDIPCAQNLQNVPRLMYRQAIDSSLVDRLKQKSDWVYEWLKHSTGDWHSVFMASLIRSFGFGINSEAFEQLALNLPVTLICRNAHDPSFIEAMLFGTAGFLNEQTVDEHQKTLQNEWQYLQKKYNLNALDKSVFKYLRMRPGNFPEIRIAQLCALISDFQVLLNMVVGLRDTAEIIELLRPNISLYWIQHYGFGKKGKRINGNLSLPSAQIVVINAVVPFLFVYGKQTGNDHFCTKALDILQCLPPEINHITNEWKSIGVEAVSAYDSQGLLGLKKELCDKRLCLNCAVGRHLMKNS